MTPNKNTKTMKKNLFLWFLLAIVGMVATGCESCKSENKKQDAPVGDVVISVANDYDGNLGGKLVAEHVISTQRETMFSLAQGKDYKWFETTIELADWLDAEGQDGTIAEVTSLFQTIVEEGKCVDTWVQYIATSATKGTMIPQPIHSFVVGDCALNDEPIKLTFDEALERVMEANCSKPHSRFCVLRKELGPKDINAQYVFGNLSSQLYVDAVTGVVTDENPAFDGGFGKPLGEWP